MALMPCHPIVMSENTAWLDQDTDMQDFLLILTATTEGHYCDPAVCAHSERYELTYTPHVSEYDTYEHREARKPVTTVYGSWDALTRALDEYGIIASHWRKGSWRLAGDSAQWTVK